jgi:hypothetical protein
MKAYLIKLKDSSKTGKYLAYGIVAFPIIIGCIIFNIIKPIIALSLLLVGEYKEAKDKLFDTFPS